MIGYLNRLLRRVGFRLSRIEYRDRFAGLAHIGKVSTVIDVGVGFGTPYLYNAFPDARLILVEPNPQFHSHIENQWVTQRDAVLHRVAAGDTDSTGALSLTATRSSLLPRAESTRRESEADAPMAEVPIRRLESILAPDEMRGPVLLKLDAEGFELKAIKGLGGLVDNVDYLVAEVSVVKRFEESYEFLELCNYMDRVGFGIAEVLEAPMKKDGRIYYLDMLFVRREKSQ